MMRTTTLSDCSEGRYQQVRPAAAAVVTGGQEAVEKDFQVLINHQTAQEAGLGPCRVQQRRTADSD